MGAEMWRNNIVNKLNYESQEWQSQWPQYSMTLIYPLITYGRRRKNRSRAVVDIRAILRVTKGATQFGNLPIYQPQYVQQQPVQSEMVALNVQQPQVMIKGADGQHMMVQGKTAIVNGREVLLVEQPSSNVQQLQLHQ